MRPDNNIDRDNKRSPTSLESDLASSEVEFETFCDNSAFSEEVVSSDG